MMTVAEPLNRLVPIESIGGIALVNIIAIVILFLLCFFSGFIAKSFFGKRLFESVDNKLQAVPGYSLFKARVTGSIGTEFQKSELKPVKIVQGEKFQVGFAVEATSDGYVVVYLPTAPDPWTGNIVYCKESLLEPMNLSK